MMMPPLVHMGLHMEPVTQRPHAIAHPSAASIRGFLEHRIENPTQWQQPCGVETEWPTVSTSFQASHPCRSVVRHGPQTGALAHL